MHLTRSLHQLQISTPAPPAATPPSSSEPPTPAAASVAAAPASSAGGPPLAKTTDDTLGQVRALHGAGSALRSLKPTGNERDRASVAAAAVVVMPMGPQTLRDASWNVLEGLSQVTRFARETTSRLFEPVATPAAGQARPLPAAHQKILADYGSRRSAAGRPRNRSARPDLERASVRMSGPGTMISGLGEPTSSRDPAGGAAARSAVQLGRV